MFSIARVTIQGFLRDKVTWSVLLIAVLLCLVPFAASLSMRQVAELSVTLCLSLVSFVLLILTLFFGGTALWKDVERRYTYSIVSLPISRSSYLLGKFFGTALFLFLVTLILTPAVCGAVALTAQLYPPDRPIQWLTLLTSIGFDLMKYLLLVSCAFLFSTVSTSFFLPIFGTIVTFLAGNMSQQVYDYLLLNTHSLSPTALAGIKGVYYIVPNFTAFDLKLNAIYGLPLDPAALFLTGGYFLSAVALLLSMACFSFHRREMK